MNKFASFYKQYFWSLPGIIWFNFHYLPFRQAVRLPILLRKPHLVSCKGKVEIRADRITTGMIRLGFYCVSVYPDRGVTWNNNGTVIFHGKCHVGNDSYISVGKAGKLTFGPDFVSTAALKIICEYSISFGTTVRAGYESMFMDTGFHRTKKIDDQGQISWAGPGYAPIAIGSYNWLGLRCTVMNGTRTPDRLIAAGGSLLNKDYSDCPANCLIAGRPAKLKATGIFRDFADDRIEYATESPILSESKSNL